MRRFIVLFVLVLSLIPAAAAQEFTCPSNNVGALTEQAGDAYDRADYQRAIDLYNCAIAIEPNDINLYNERGNAYYLFEMYTEALEDYQRALEIDPNYSYAYNNIANIYDLRGKYDDALEYYTRSIELGGGNLHIPYYNRGNLYFEMGEYETALADLESALNIDPTYASAYLARGMVYLATGNSLAYADYIEWLRLTRFETVDAPLDGQGADYVMEEGLVYNLTFSGKSGQTFNAAARILTDAYIDPLLVLLDGNGQAITADDDSGVNLDAVIRDFTLPSDGTYTLMLGLAGGSTVYDGTVTLTAGLDGLAIGGSGQSTVSEDAEVDPFATYKLFVDTQAEVFTTEGDRLNLREGPGLTFEIVAKLERGTLVTLLEGPRKNDGYAWWNIELSDGTTGWAVERVEEEQTLQLALQVLEDAFVNGDGEKLNVRAEAARGATVVFQLEDGERVTLTAAPVIADNFRWWPIQTSDGRTGWAVDRIGLDRTLVPARERE